jgi:DNA mismatch repair protein MutS
VVDRIFTRVGASDNLSSGQSTFMVEMSEMACILNTATKNSLLILDEIGRGTATYDGLSIAWAVLEHIVKVTGAKTMFATHYHELTVLENELEGVKNLSVSVKELGDNIVFLHKIVQGGADRSFGIQVGALAGLPDSVVWRAKQILKGLEKKPKQNGLTLEDYAQSVVVDEVYSQIKRIDPDELSPKEALNLLFHLHKIVNTDKAN